MATVDSLSADILAVITAGFQASGTPAAAQTAFASALAAAIDTYTVAKLADLETRVGNLEERVTELENRVP